MATSVERAALAFGAWVPQKGELPPDLAPWDAEAYASGVMAFQAGHSLAVASSCALCSSHPSTWRRRYAEGWLDAQRVARRKGG